MRFFLLAMLLVALRALCEMSMMSAHGPDAQMGIWFAAMVFWISGWAISGFLLAFIAAKARSSTSGPSAAVVLLGVWAICLGISSARYYNGGRALSQASGASTAPEQLEQLSDFTGLQAGYELDNRVAENPNTSVETLRKLYHRNNLGTRMVLARNPNTPADILTELSNDEDEWIQKSLAVNPNYGAE